VSTKFTVSVLVLATALTACGDGLTSKAKPERLSGLLDGGIDAERQAALTTRFENAIANNDVATALQAEFDGDSASDAPTVSLADTLQAALERNPEIGRAAQRINRADAERLNAIFGYLPQLTASATYAQNEQEVIETDNDVFQLGTASYPSLDAQVELRQPIFDLGRIYGLKLSSAMRSSAEVEYIATVQKVMYETFDTYLRAAQSRNRVTALQRRQGLISRQLSAETTRADAGISEESAKNALRIEVANIGVDLSQERLRYNTALSDLAFLSGKRITNVTTLSTPAGVFGTERRVSAEAAIQTASKNNPELLGSVIAVAEQDLRKRQAISADFAPVLEAFARLQYEDREASRFGGGSTTMDTIYGVRLVVPLFNADGQGYSNLIARVDFRDALLQYFAQKRQISADIYSTHNRLGEISKSISESRRAVGGARALVNSERALVEAGKSEEFLVAALQAREVQAQERVRYYELEYLRAWGRFEYLSGMNLAEKL